MSMALSEVRNPNRIYKCGEVFFRQTLLNGHELKEATKGMSGHMTMHYYSKFAIWSPVRLLFAEKEPHPETPKADL